MGDALLVVEPGYVGHRDLERQIRSGPAGVRHRREYRQFDRERRTFGELLRHVERDLVRPDDVRFWDDAAVLGEIARPRRHRVRRRHDDELSRRAEERARERTVERPRADLRRIGRPLNFDNPHLHALGRTAPAAPHQAHDQVGQERPER